MVLNKGRIGLVMQHDAMQCGALDAKNERAIVENLNKFYEGRTVVIVAHRLSTVKNADQIIVLDGGKVIEIGNHSYLIEKKGTYYNLIKNQLEIGD